MYEQLDGRIALSVYQYFRDLQGTVAFDGLVMHVCSFQSGFITQMDIEPVA